MVTAKITKFNKKSIPVVFFYFLCLLCWNIPSFAEFPEYFSLVVTDQECGTLKDPNYRAAFYALQDAMKFFQGRLTNDFSREPYFFPKAVDDILDESGNLVFYYEGSLSWQTEASNWDGEISPDVPLCKRVMCKATQIDVPLCVFQGEGKPSIYPPRPVFLEEEQIFKLYKDYSALLSVFYVLQQDFAFISENNKSFLQRRIQDPQRYYTTGCIVKQLGEA